MVQQNRWLLQTECFSHQSLFVRAVRGEATYLVVGVAWKVFAIVMRRQNNTSRCSRVFRSNDIGETHGPNGSVIGKLIFFDGPMKGLKCGDDILPDYGMIVCLGWIMEYKARKRSSDWWLTHEHEVLGFWTDEKTDLRDPDF